VSTLQKLVLVEWTLLACILLAAASYAGSEVVTFYAVQPLGPRLPLPQPTLVDDAAPPSAATAAPGLAASGDAIEIEPDMPAPICGGPSVMHLLAVGSDARSDSYNYGLADIIRVVRLDFSSPRVSILEMPRDLWVEIPDISDDIGQDHEKLNQAYLYGNPGFGYFDDPSAGPGLLGKTLAVNFDLATDRYMAVNMRTFEKIVDAVDGIDITLAESIDGRTDDDRSSRLVFKAGSHHLSGTEALTLARIRNEGVFARASNQDLVLCALRDRLASPDVVGRAPELIGSFADNVQTDLSPAELGQMACLGSRLQKGDIVFAEFPEELFTQGRVYDPVFKKRLFVWETDFDVLRGYVRRFQAGTWPTLAEAGPDGDAGFSCP